VVSAVQLMAAGETEAQFWRHPSRSAPPPAPTSLRSSLTSANRSLSSISRSRWQDNHHDVSAHTAL